MDIGFNESFFGLAVSLLLHYKYGLLFYNNGSLIQVILSLKSGVYYGLDPVGATVWDLIQEPKSLSEVRDAVLQEYDVEPERCEDDLRALLQELVEEGLVEVT